jgi:dTDP-4-dehydrorhamnose 3,5-epimerase
MKVLKTSIDGLVIIEPRVFGDERGFFLETYHADRYRAETGLDVVYVQDNHSCSTRGVLRGLHFQKSKPQGKLLRCISGVIYDDASSVFRRASPMASKWSANVPKWNTNVAISTIPVMRVALPGTIQISRSHGLSPIPYFLRRTRRIQNSPG